MNYTTNNTNTSITRKKIVDIFITNINTHIIRKTMVDIFIEQIINTDILYLMYDDVDKGIKDILHIDLKFQDLLESCRTGDKLKHESIKKLLSLQDTSTNITKHQVLKTYPFNNQYILTGYSLKYINKFKRKISKIYITYLNEKIPQDKRIKLLRNNPELLEIFIW